MFRKLYWVVEHLDLDGRGHVAGVFTSIPDLIRLGLNSDARLRLTLTKLDSSKDPFGSWTSPGYEGMEQCLEEFIRTDEFTREHCVALSNALRGSVAA